MYVNDIPIGLPLVTSSVECSLAESLIFFILFFFLLNSDTSVKYIKNTVYE